MKNPDIPEDLHANDVCCRALFDFLIEGRLALAYDASTRSLKIFNKHYQWVQEIKYCPFCGSRQQSLAQEWEEALNELLGPDFTDSDVPAEFQSDAWWRNRNL